MCGIIFITILFILAFIVLCGGFADHVRDQYKNRKPSKLSSLKSRLEKLEDRNRLQQLANMQLLQVHKLILEYKKLGGPNVMYHDKYNNNVIVYLQDGTNSCVYLSIDSLEDLVNQMRKDKLEKLLIESKPVQRK